MGDAVPEAVHEGAEISELFGCCGRSNDAGLGLGNDPVCGRGGVGRGPGVPRVKVVSKRAERILGRWVGLKKGIEESAEHVGPRRHLAF